MANDNRLVTWGYYDMQSPRAGKRKTNSRRKSAPVCNAEHTESSAAANQKPNNQRKSDPICNTEQTGVIPPIVDEGAIVDDTPLSKQTMKGVKGHKLRQRLRVDSGGKKTHDARSSSSSSSRMKSQLSRNTKKRKDGEVRDTAYRASLHGIRLLIEDLKLDNDHIEIMKKTPFWRLFESILDKKLTTDLCKKSDRMIAKIINSYDPETDGFKLGLESARITRADIAKIFGIVDGSERVKLKHGCRDAVKMVKNGLLTDERLTSASIKLATVKYASRTEMKFKKDVVRLLCAYLLHSLFFPTGTTVRWVCLERVEDLNQLSKYDWCGAILNELMSSIRQHHGEPRKVSGCVVVLLYWVCERTNLVKPLNPQERLGCIKWRTWDLSKELQKTSLNELKVDQVVPELNCGTVETTLPNPNDGCNVETVPLFKDGSAFEKGLDSAGSADQQGTDHQFNANECGVCHDLTVGTTDNEDGIRHSPKNDYNARLIDELRDQIAKMCDQMEENKEQHSSEIARKDAEIARKDAEIAKKDVEIASLNETVLMLLGEKSKLCDELTETIVHGVTQVTRPMIEVHHERSMVTRLRTRSRKDTKKEEYVYDNKRKRSTTFDDPEQVVDVEDFTAIPKKVPQKPIPIRSLSTKPVYRNLSKDDKLKIKKMWSEAHTSTIIWTGTVMGCHLFVEDIRPLIEDSALPGNVIDAYAEVLFTEQEKRTNEVEADCTQPESRTTYVFTCSFLTMLGCKCPDERKRVLEKMMTRTSSYRYLMFPIHFGFHWTLLVLDNEEGCWLFYNSIKERSGVDPNLKAAEQVKNQVEGYWKSTRDGLLSTQDCRPIEPVENCPQQADSSLDCGVIVCYILRQYFRNEPVAAKLARADCQRMRSDIVEAFVGGEHNARESD